MKLQLVIILLGMTLAPCSGFAAIDPDDERDQETNPLEDWEVLKKPLEKQRQEQLAEKMQGVLDVFGAIGGVAAQLVGAGPRVDPEPFEQQLAPQFGQLLAAELRFVHTICRPTPEQFQTIKAAGGASLKVAIKKCARVQAQTQEGGFQFGAAREMPDPRKIIVEALAKSVTQTLSAEQTKCYQFELEKRAAARRRAALLNLVAALDHQLVLTAEQRSQLTEILNTHWKDNWGQPLERYMYNGQFLPLLPESRVLPLLNATQKDIWKQMAAFAGDGTELSFLLQGDFVNDVDVLEAVEDSDQKIDEEDQKNNADTNKEQNGQKP